MIHVKFVFTIADLGLKYFLQKRLYWGDFYADGLDVIKDATIMLFRDIFIFCCEKAFFSQIDSVWKVYFKKADTYCLQNDVPS